MINTREIWIIFGVAVVIIGASAVWFAPPPPHCTLYEQYTRQISDTVDGPFRPRVYVRCIQEERQ